jgi:hypothetical protein
LLHGTSCVGKELACWQGKAAAGCCGESTWHNSEYHRWELFKYILLLLHFLSLCNVSGAAAFQGCQEEWLGVLARQGGSWLLWREYLIQQ